LSRNAGTPDSANARDDEEYRRRIALKLMMRKPVQQICLPGESAIIRCFQPSGG
jgi:hypothetical protein